MVSAQPGVPPFTWPSCTRSGPFTGGAEQRADEVPAPPKHPPVNVSVVCKHSESTHCLCSYVCSLVHTHNCPSRRPLGFIFLGCTFVSLVAMKVPGPQWVWFLTSSPSSFTSSFLYTSGADFVPPELPPPPPPFFLPVFLTGMSSWQLPLACPHF